MKAIIIILALMLAGCNSIPEVKAPEVVYVTVEKLPELTEEQRAALADCDIREPASDTVKELVAVARARKDSLKDCNVDKGMIRSWFDL